MKVLLSSILFLIFISCQNNTAKVNVYDSQENKAETQDSLQLDTIELKTTKNETIEEFLQRMKKISLSNNDEKLEEIINFPLIVRGLDENLDVFEESFNSFSEIKDNVMLYEAIFKAGISSATSIHKGNCDLFYKNKNCYIIKSTEIGEFEIVILKKNNLFKIISIEILTA